VLAAKLEQMLDDAFAARLAFAALSGTRKAQAAVALVREFNLGLGMAFSRRAIGIVTWPLLVTRTVRSNSYFEK
jgi:hypothetical protein